MSTTSSDTPSNPTDQPVSFVQHLEELRRRIGVCFLAFLVAAGVGFWQAEGLLAWLRVPAGPLLPSFVFFAPTEALGAYLKVASLAGLAISMPVLLWQAWSFVRPGLLPRERSLGAVFVGWGSVLFVAGGAFAYFVLLPASLRILLGVGRGLLQPMISVERYLAYALGLIGWCGVVFELPVVVYLLAKVGIVTPEWLRQQRPLAILGLVVAAALLTPTTDILNQLLVFLPMIVLYEISIPLARLARTGP